eukprot:g3054.t1
MKGSTPGTSFRSSTSTVAQQQHSTNTKSSYRPPPRSTSTTRLSSYGAHNSAGTSVVSGAAGAFTVGTPQIVHRLGDGGGGGTSTTTTKITVGVPDLRMTLQKSMSERTLLLSTRANKLKPPTPLGIEKLFRVENWKLPNRSRLRPLREREDHDHHDAPGVVPPNSTPPLYADIRPVRVLSHLQRQQQSPLVQNREDHEQATMINPARGSSKQPQGDHRPLQKIPQHPDALLAKTARLRKKVEMEMSKTREGQRFAESEVGVSLKKVRYVEQQLRQARNELETSFGPMHLTSQRFKRQEQKVGKLAEDFKKAENKHLERAADANSKAQNTSEIRP